MKMGDVIGLVGIGHDITDRIKLEHEREDILAKQKQYSLGRSATREPH